jgi:hypothetical protein
MILGIKLVAKQALIRITPKRQDSGFRVLEIQTGISIQCLYTCFKKVQENFQILCYIAVFWQMQAKRHLNSILKRNNFDDCFNNLQ